MLEELKKSIKNYLPLDLQFFADEGGGNDSDSQNNDNSGIENAADDKNTNTHDNNTKNNTTNKRNENLFTQEDVNNIVARESRTAVEKLLKQLGVKDVKTAKDGLQKFKEMQDKQKTEAEKATERAEELETENKNLIQQVEVLNAQLSALKANVKSESVEDVVILAKSMVSEEVTIDDAIGKVLEKYPHFKNEVKTDGDVQKDNKPRFSVGDHKDKAQTTEKDLWLNAFNWVNNNKK